MDRYLEVGESISFDLPQFHCDATKMGGPWLRSESIDVVISFGGGGDRYIFRMGPNLTIDQIKEFTAYKLLDLLKDWAIDLQKVAVELRSKV